MTSKNILEDAFGAVATVTLKNSEVKAGNLGTGVYGPLDGLKRSGIEEAYVIFINNCQTLEDVESAIKQNERIERRLVTNPYTPYQSGTGFSNFTTFVFDAIDASTHEFKKETFHRESGKAYFFFYPRNIRLLIKDGFWNLEMLTSHLEVIKSYQTPFEASSPLIEVSKHYFGVHGPFVYSDVELELNAVPFEYLINLNASNIDFKKFSCRVEQQRLTAYTIGELIGI
jgi:hypothetical protein